METRKLQRVGGGTYTVSIPKEWATSRGLEAGTSVHLHSHHDGSLVVRSHEMDRGCLDAVRVAVDDDPHRAERLLRAAQTAGFERVTLATDGSFGDDTTRTVRSLVRGVVGADLVDESDGTLVVRNLLDASDVSIRQSVVQLQFVSLSVHNRATDAFVGDGSAEDEQLRERVGEADRLFEMIGRHLGRALVSFEELDLLGTTRPALFDYYETARLLRDVAAEGATVARAASRLSEPLADDTGDRFRRLADAAGSVAADAAVAVLEGHDAERLHRIDQRRETTHTGVTDWVESLHEGDPADVSEAVALVRSLDALGRTLDHGGAIIDVALRSLARNRQLSDVDGCDG